MKDSSSNDEPVLTRFRYLYLARTLRLEKVTMMMMNIYGPCSRSKYTAKITRYKWSLRKKVFLEFEYFRGRVYERYISLSLFPWSSLKRTKKPWSFQRSYRFSLSLSAFLYLSIYLSNEQIFSRDRTHPMYIFFYIPLYIFLSFLYWVFLFFFFFT